MARRSVTLSSKDSAFGVDANRKTHVRTSSVSGNGRRDSPGSAHTASHQTGGLGRDRVQRLAASVDRTQGRSRRAIPADATLLERRSNHGVVAGGPDRYGARTRSRTIRRLKEGSTESARLRLGTVRRASLAFAGGSLRRVGQLPNRARRALGGAIDCRRRGQPRRSPRARRAHGKSGVVADAPRSISGIARSRRNAVVRGVTVRSSGLTPGARHHHLDRGGSADVGAPVARSGEPAPIERERERERERENAWLCEMAGFVAVVRRRGCANACRQQTACPRGVKTWSQMHKWSTGRSNFTISLLDGHDFYGIRGSPSLDRTRRLGRENASSARFLERR